MPFRSPLHHAESLRGAQFVEFHSWEIARDYGDPCAEYRAVREAAGALDLSYQGKLRAMGKDRVRYLHNMTTSDIRNLKSGTGCYALLLTHQGRIESDMHIHSLDDSLLIELPPSGMERAFATLNKYIVADDVRLEDQTERLSILCLQGPLSRERMEHTVGISLAGLEQLQHHILRHEAGEWIVVRRDRTGCDGYDLWLPSQDAVGVWQGWLEADKILPVGHQALDWLRTEAGTPWYGLDMDDRNLPMELGLSSAISLTKGCYRGQEIVARIHYRGHLDRRLAAVVLRQNELPDSGAEIRSQGEKIGTVTSAILSPRLQRPLALCILKSEFLAPGTAVEVARGHVFHPGEVVALPLR